MRALLLLPLQRFILSIRLWVTEHIFARSGDRSRAPIWLSLIIGSICALALFGYSQSVQYFGLPKLDYTDTSLYPSLITLGGILLYTLGVLLFNYLLNTFRNTKITGSSVGLLVKETLIRGLLLGGGYYFLGHIAISPIIIYYLLVAGTEEGLKRLNSIILHRTGGFTLSDLILFALLVSLGFAFLENIIYMLQRTDALYSIQEQLGVGSGVLITRGIVGFVVHMLFTGVIAYVSMIGLRKGQSRRLFLALLAGIALHMSYNILLYYNITIIVGFYLLAGYFMLSRLFWKSDGVYLD